MQTHNHNQGLRTLRYMCECGSLLHHALIKGEVCFLCESCKRTYAFTSADLSVSPSLINDHVLDHSDDVFHILSCIRENEGVTLTSIRDYCSEHAHPLSYDTAHKRIKALRASGLIWMHKPYNYLWKFWITSEGERFLDTLKRGEG